MAEDQIEIDVEFDAEEQQKSGLSKESLAEQFIEYSYGYYRYKDNFSNFLEAEPSNYEDREAYQDEVKQCVDYSIDYFCMFDERTPWFNPLKWRFYDQIIETNIKERFPRDHNIRALMYAYRLLFERNQMVNIAKKRALVFFWLLLIFAPTSSFVFWLPYIPDVFTDLDTWPPFVLFGFVAIWIALVTRSIWFGLGVTTNNLRGALRANAANLAQMVQNRLDGLSKLYQSYLSKINDEELASEKGGLDPNWPVRAMWDMQLAIWFSKRLEYIEKSLQIEMQRLRIFVVCTDPFGNLVAWSLYVVAVVLAALPMLFFGYELPEQLLPYWLAAFGITAFLGYRGTRRSTSIEHSITVDNIRKWIESSNWTTYAELEVIDSIGEAIRQSKEDYRLMREQLAGKKP